MIELSKSPTLGIITAPSFAYVIPFFIFGLLDDPADLLRFNKFITPNFSTAGLLMTTSPGVNIAGTESVLPVPRTKPPLLNFLPNPNLKNLNIFGFVNIFIFFNLGAGVNTPILLTLVGPNEPNAISRSGRPTKERPARPATVYIAGTKAPILSNKRIIPKTALPTTPATIGKTFSTNAVIPSKTRATTGLVKTSTNPINI